MMDTGHSGDIPFSAVLKAVLLPMNKAELINKSCTLLKVHHPTELVRMMLKAPRTPNTFCFTVLIWVEHVCEEKVFCSSAFEATQCLASPRKKKHQKKRSYKARGVILQHSLLPTVYLIGVMHSLMIHHETIITPFFFIITSALCGINKSNALSQIASLSVLHRC